MRYRGEHARGQGQRVTLSSGCFAMMDDGTRFQLVPWRPASEQQLGRQVGGVIAPGGNIEHSFGPKQEFGI
jgi:Protein of unknown function (DUF3363)